MIDSDNRNALDNYGVWVKKSPKDISAESDSLKKSDDSFEIAADLPDFSALDSITTEPETKDDFDSGETALTSEELFNITGDISSAPIIEESSGEPFADIPDAADSITESPADSTIEEPVIESGTEEPAPDSIFETPSIEIPSFDEPSETSAEPVSEDVPANPETDGPSDAQISDILTQNTPTDPNAFYDISFDESDTDEILNDTPADTSDSIEDFPAEAPLEPFADIQTELSDEIPAEEPVTEDTIIETPSFDDVLGDDSASEISESSTDSFDSLLSEEETAIEPEISEPAAEAAGSDSIIEEPIIESPMFNEEPVDELSSEIQASSEEPVIDDNISETPFEEVQAGNISEEDSLIPDTFDEETAMFTDEIEVGPTETEENKESNPAPSVQNDIIAQSNAILLQIQKELSSLQNEITSLKNDFNEFKAANKAAPAETPEKQEESGFFSEVDEDETISLSGDELNNILINADETEETSSESPASPDEEEISDTADTSDAIDENVISEPETSPIMEEPVIETPVMEEIIPPAVEEPVLDSSDETPAAEITDDDFYKNEEAADSDFSINFEDENNEAPQLDSIEIVEESEDEAADIPDELSVPKIEDVLVDSSNTEDLMESSDLPSASEIESPAEVPAEPVEETLTLEEESAPAAVSPFEDVPEAEEDTMFGDLAAALNGSGSNEETAELDEEDQLAPVAETKQIDLQTETLDDLYPKDPPLEETLTEDTLDYLASDDNQDALSVSDDIEYVPVDELSGNPSDSIIEEPEVQGQAANSIPSDLAKDIKSVLSYMDQLLENLPDEKISEFAQSEQFITYKKLFTELGLA